MPLTVVQAGVGGTGTTDGFNNFKNRLFNGNMVLDQRNAGASVTPTTSQYTLDRWLAEVGSVASKYSVQQNAGSVTPPAGFSNYLGITSTSAYTPGATDNFTLQQRIEGFNSADLNWGTANAKTVTLSFWVRSSLTGTFGGEIFINGSTARTFPYTYTISAANTWQYKTITIVGDTQSNTIPSTNGLSLVIVFMLGAGSSNVGGTANTWQNGNILAPAGCVNVVSTNGATWYVTGVQLEVSSTASGFDYRPYGTELALCQRYYQSAPDETIVVSRVLAGAYDSWLFPVTMRAAPTVTMIGYTGGGTVGIATTIYGFYTSNSGNESGVGYTASAEL